MKIALAQINPTIADIGGNVAKIKNFASRARELGADIAVFPELCVTGYPPMDLLENQKFISDNISALDEIKNAGLGIAVIVGFISAHDGRLYNSAALIDSSQIKFICHKTLLPTYDVFDEDRYFESAAVRVPVDFCGSKIGITICEDIWNASPELAEEFEMRRYSVDPVAELVAAGSDIIVNLSASPFVKGKNSFKRRMIASVAMKHSVPVVYVNQVGGNDSLVFDGYSFAAGGDGGIAALCAGFEEDIVVYDTLRKDEITIAENEIGDIEKALVLGLRDYVYKSGFKSVLVGLSGGIDSALTAALAVKALGSGNVTGVTMPSRYSSAGSVDDSQTLADNLKIKFHNIPIKSLHDLFLSELSPVFAGMKPDVTEENLQARIRGNILMALSNKFGSLLLTTGNKSELAMGYCTLYGDMSGGLAVISDLPKMLVYELSRYINRNSEIIPAATIEKAPSAELRENQKDEDSLPPYEILDAVLECYIEKRMSMKQIIDKGFDPEVVRFVLKCVDRNEYKRRQAAPGLKVTSKAFGTGRRIPVVQKFNP